MMRVPSPHELSVSGPSVNVEAGALCVLKSVAIQSGERIVLEMRN
jgi:hypothetical protein